MRVDLQPQTPTVPTVPNSPTVPDREHTFKQPVKPDKARQAPDSIPTAVRTVNPTEPRQFPNRSPTGPTEPTAWAQGISVFFHLGWMVSPGLPALPLVLCEHEEKTGTICRRERTGMCDQPLRLRGAHRAHTCLEPRNILYSTQRAHLAAITPLGDLVSLVFDYALILIHRDGLICEIELQ